MRTAQRREQPPLNARRKARIAEDLDEIIDKQRYARTRDRGNLFLTRRREHHGNAGSERLICKPCQRGGAQIDIGTRGGGARFMANHPQRHAAFIRPCEKFGDTGICARILHRRTIHVGLQFAPTLLTVGPRAQSITQSRFVGRVFEAQRVCSACERLRVIDDRVVEVETDAALDQDSVHRPRDSRSIVGFFQPAEDALAERFLRDGYIVAPAEDRAALDRIRTEVASATAEFLGVALPADHGAFLDNIAPSIESPERLNALRLHVIDRLRTATWFREAYFATARETLASLIGNELAMQRGLGFSIQLPGDESSVLPLHSDAWSEDSPFELVLWVPLVDVVRSKAMFLLPPAADAMWRDKMASFASVEELFTAVEPEIRYIEVPYGSVLIFTHTMMHGNRRNAEPAARWSMNVRFKGLFTPYSDKQLGDFFDPITLRPASRIGLTYRLPGGFNG